MTYGPHEPSVQYAAAVQFPPEQTPEQHSEPEEQVIPELGPGLQMPQHASPAGWQEEQEVDLKGVVGLGWQVVVLQKPRQVLVVPYSQ